MNTPQLLKRRSFLGKSACSAMGAGGLMNAVLQLRTIQAASTIDPADDYKALVCLFLVGGNDSDSLIVPTSSADYTTYNDHRQHLAIPNAGDANGLLPITPATADPYGRTFGINPAVPEVRDLFNAGNLAFVGNVGTMIRPTTRAELVPDGNNLNYSVAPPQIFSHADQTMLWQNSVPNIKEISGWGGRMADVVNSVNGNADLSMSISLDGTNTFQVGNQVSQYHVTPDGSVSINDYIANGSFDTNSRRSRALDNIYEVAHGNLMENQFRDLMARSARNDRLITNALADPVTNITTQFPNTRVGDQMRMIARLIATRSTLGLKRQVYFCGINGFDTHGATLAAYSDRIQEAAQAMNAFYNATVELGVQDKVTTFTASEFGRTFTHNGVGTDHGWGGTQMVMGGCVQGGDIYGTMQRYQIDALDDTTNGRWAPSTSVDEYSATLAKWFGVTSGDMDQVFPNIGVFPTDDLGFMM